MWPEPPAMPVQVDPLPYEARLAARDVADITLVVIHCTEVPTLAESRRFGEQVLYPASGTGNSGHFYIDRDGSVHQYVDPARVAHHVRGHNAGSIGIELVNTGRYPHWLDSRHQGMDEPYTHAQVDALVALLRDLQARYPSLATIAGHEDLDTTREPASDDASVQVARKRDPGPLFPWDRVLMSTRLQRIP